MEGGPTMIMYNHKKVIAIMASRLKIMINCDCFYSQTISTTITTNSVLPILFKGTKIKKASFAAGKITSYLLLFFNIFLIQNGAIDEASASPPGD